MGLGWTTAGVQNLILGMADEKTAAALQKTCADLPFVQQTSGNEALLVKRIKAHLNGKMMIFWMFLCNIPLWGRFL